MKTILVDAVFCYISPTGEIFREMHELLESFPNPKIVLTGANDEQYQTFGLAKIPYEVFTLKHTPEKADPLYYTTMLEHFHLTPHDVIYFEHDPNAVASAQSVGILTYHYDDEKKDLIALKHFLTTNV